MYKMAGQQQGKMSAVRSLMQALEEDLKTRTLTEASKVDLLSQLKVYGRDPRDADAIYSDQGLRTLCLYAFEQESARISQEAMRIIANALLLQPQFRSKLVEMNRAESLVKIYHRQDDNDEFLAARILFLLTYGTQTDFKDLIENHQLTEALLAHLQRHSKFISQDSASLSQFSEMALVETMKLLFNIANALPAETATWSTMIGPLATILIHVKSAALPFDVPMNTIVNALAILDFGSHQLPPSADIIEHSEKMSPKLVVMLDAAIDRYKPADLDTSVIPLLTVLRKVYDVLPSISKHTLQKALLPDDKERDKPLGQSSTLASKLLRLIVSPGLTNLPESIGALLFEISDKNAGLFVKNIGYGYAAGYLMTHKIPIPEDAKSSQNSSSRNEIPINPVTGQRLDKETVVDPIEMTEEEKEREAERLFVLFERLKATGVMDVQNPVEQAVAEGRFEELSDSD